MEKRENKGKKFMHIRIVGVPSDLGASCRGSDLGPNAIRYVRLPSAQEPKKEVDLIEKLHELGYTVSDEGNLPVPPPEPLPYKNEKLKNLDPILAVCETLAEVVECICRAEDFPLVIGGDHSISVGSITGVAKARGKIGVIWVDAHGDFNTDKISPSGNIHGMPLAALAGIGNERLVNLGDVAPKLDLAHIVVIGARALDPGEREMLRKARVSVFTMKDIDRQGISKTIAQALEITTSGTNGLHVSFDIDALDPREAPGVGTPVRGGLSYREARLAMELIADSGKLISLDMVEVNPVLDQRNRTARAAAELILAMLGRRLF